MGHAFEYGFDLHRPTSTSAQCQQACRVEGAIAQFEETDNVGFDKKPPSTRAELEMEQERLHEEVFANVSPLLEDGSPAMEWLKTSCEKIDRP